MLLLQIRDALDGDDRKGRHGVAEAGRGLPGARVELVAVPWAFEITLSHAAFAQWSVLMGADIRQRVERALEADDGEALATGGRGCRLSLRQPREIAQGNEPVGASRRRAIPGRLLERRRDMKGRDRADHGEEGHRNLL